ncbi:MAG: phosphatidylserine decarboxylase [Alphaproteobacteria bacterium]
MSFSIHPEGWRFVAIFFFISLICYWAAPGLGLVGFVLTAWCLYFFRSPRRITPTRDDVIVSPADGIVCAIIDAVPPAEYDLGEEPRTRVSVFLNVFDVHVNRIPLAGTVSKYIYHPGKFFNASLDKASEHNERLTLVIHHAKITYAVIQIAGLIARRIRCDVKEGDVLTTGQLYGLIRFGSRVDVWLPQGAQLQVLKGQRMIAGETIIATF